MALNQNGGRARRPGSVLEPRGASSKPWAAPLGGPKARAGLAELKIFARQPKSLALGEEGSPLSRKGSGRRARSGGQEGREGDEAGQQGRTVLVADGGGKGLLPGALRRRLGGWRDPADPGALAPAERCDSEFQGGGAGSEGDGARLRQNIHLELGSGNAGRSAGQGLNGAPAQAGGVLRAEACGGRWAADV